MAENHFHRSHSKHRAALFALFAIALIVIAPLISVSLQKDPMSAMPGMMHHDMSMMHGDHDGSKSTSMPVDHAEACGYCVLLAHMPGIILALVLLLCAILLRVRSRASPQAVQHWHFTPWLYPDTRAPPALSAFTC